MARLVKSRSQRRGLPPGTAVYIGDALAGQARITAIDYSKEDFSEQEIGDAAQCAKFRDTATVTWINVDGIHDLETIETLCQEFDIHPLVREDILCTDERPKTEDYGRHIYIVVKMLQWDSAAARITREQVSIILGSNFVISFQERAGDVFDPIRDRIRADKGRVRQMGADYLATSLLDATLEGYFQILEQLGELSEDMETRLTSRAAPEDLRDLHRLKRESLFFRKAAWPMREMIGNLQRSESEIVSEEVDVYIRNLYDHAVHVVDTLETFRDVLSGLMDCYLTTVNNHMNEIMKVLTIIATIFIPLTFIAGVYGMNFKNMPELDKSWGYPAALGAMLVVAVIMVIFFRRKKWL